MAIDLRRRAWRPVRARAGALLGSISLLVACQGAPIPVGSTSATAGPPGSPPAATQSGSHGGVEPGAATWIFDSGATPVDLTITLDEGKRVEVVMPTGGGTVSATGADGTEYTLVIPSDALLVDTTIGLTPVATLSGLPFGGDQTHAVQLSPDGLFLYAPAVLTITPTQAIPVGEQIPFGYLADGRDVILAEPVPEAPGIAIRVDHFSGNGVTRGVLADTEPDRRRLGGDAERRLAGALSDALVHTRQTGGATDFDSIESVMEQYERDVVRPRIAAAGESCAAGRLAIQTVFGLGRQRALLGLEASTINVEAPLVEKATRACVVEEFELCVEDHVVHRMAQVWRAYEREFALYREFGVPVGDGPLNDARELTVKCLTFRLDFESTASLDAGNGGYTSNVTSEIILRFDADTFTLEGDGVLANESFHFRAPCGAVGITGGGGIEVRSLRFRTARPDQFDSREIDLTLSYLPGPTSESARVKHCPPLGGESTLPPTPYWTTAFLGTHVREIDATGEFGGGYIAVDWEVLGGEFYARKEWSKQSGGGGGILTEAGMFELHHTPGA